jgi:hypothetical protein
VTRGARRDKPTIGREHPATAPHPRPANSPPGQSVGGLSQLPCADANCVEGFIDDYFGPASVGSNIDAPLVWTHFPSDVTADGGGPVYYQHQSTRDRAAFGLRHRALNDRPDASLAMVPKRLLTPAEIRYFVAKRIRGPPRCPFRRCAVRSEMRAAATAVA